MRPTKDIHEQIKRLDNNIKIWKKALKVADSVTLTVKRDWETMEEETADNMHYLTECVGFLLIEKLSKKDLSQLVIRWRAQRDLEGLSY
jgi:hypothetical protein